MTFENSKTLIGGRIGVFTATVLLIAYLILTYFAKLIKYPLLGLSDTHWTIILLAIYFLYTIYPMVLNYQYVFYSDDGDTIVFRYFMAGIFGGKKNSVQINKSSFAGFKTEKRYFGLIHSITLYQHFREGVASYPPIYISNLTPAEKAKVLNSLYLHSPKEVNDVT
jgi:hypothetical protein